MAGFTYLSPLIPHDDTQKLVAGVLLGALLLYLGARAAKPLRAERSRKELIIPKSKFSLTGFFDMLMESFIRFQDSVLGKENRKYLPLCASVFFFVLLANLLALIPGMPVITNTVWINVGIALVVFIAFNAYGIKENGLWGYIKHFGGPVLVLAPLIMVLEIMSVTLRVLTLNLRLYWVIKADHIILDTAVDLVGLIVPVFFYMLGSFISFMQAFVFTILTMIYILLATQHGEEH
jgi:F-type H+-transporting ATPase subunit a